MVHIYEYKYEDTGPARNRFVQFLSLGQLVSFTNFQ